jgi:hypothetical protein
MGMSGRIRTVKPEWLEDQRISMASPEARVLSVALLLMADDHGNGRAAPEGLVAMKAFPGHADRYRPALEELVRLHYVELYTADEQDYFSIRNWKKHQKVTNPSLPRVPGPPSIGSNESLNRVSIGSQETVEIPSLGSRSRSGTPIPTGTPTGSGSEGYDGNAETRPASHGPARSAPEHASGIAKEFEERAAKMAARARTDASADVKQALGFTAVTVANQD